MEELKFRAWDKTTKDYTYFELDYMFNDRYGLFILKKRENFIIEQFTGLKDKNGKEIYFGDILRFSDKWEWYKGKYGIRMTFAEGERLEKLKKEYEAEPYEERIIEDISDYDWLLSSEIQTYWEVVGNIYENKKSLEDENIKE